MTKRVILIATAVFMFAAFAASLDAAIVRDTLLRENFNGTWSTTSPPTGWQIVYDAPVDNSDWYRNGSGSNYYAYLYYYPSTTATDRLITPAFNCTANPYLSVWLICDHEYNYYGGGYTAQIRGSANNGSSWPNILKDYANTTSPLMTEWFDITSWANGQTSCRIDWYGNGYIWNINWWRVDNVFVIGEWDDGGGSSEEIDLAMTQIMRPYDVEQPGVGFKPKCRIFNPYSGEQPNEYLADPTVWAEVSCKIKDMGTMQTVYEDILGSYPLEYGYNEVDAFKNFTPDAAGNKTYRIDFVVEAENDADVNESNNDAWKVFNCPAGIQVDAVAISAPVDSQFGDFPPTADFTEMLGTATTGVTLFCEIKDATYNAVVYNEVLTQNFDANQTNTVPFPEVGFGTLTNGNTYTITFGAISGKTLLGETMTKDFKWTEGVEETPVVASFDLSVAGSNVNFSLGASSNVSVKLYDAAGSLVSTLASGSYTAGSHSVSVGNLGSGVYFVKMFTPSYTGAAKVTVVK